MQTTEEMERALREASERRRPWEVVLSDYYMPRFRASGALALLRRLGYQGVGVGQQSMRQRAREIGGVLEVESAPGGGTRVRFEAPVSRMTGR